MASLFGPYSRHLDKRDEQLAREDDGNKHVRTPRVDAHLVFPDCSPVCDGAALATRLAHARVESFYAADRLSDAAYVFDGRHLAFPSTNDAAHAQVWHTARRRRAAVIVGHWNAQERSYHRLAHLMNWAGISAAIVTMPHHGRRLGPGRVIADAFLSESLGGTIAAVRQGVIEVRRTIDWLSRQGYEDIAVVGASLGSCVAGLSAVVDTRVKASALLLTAGDFAETVWFGRATRHLRQTLEPFVSLPQLQQIWSIIGLEAFVLRLARPSHSMLLVSAKRDTVVLPSSTMRFDAQLREAGAKLVDHLWLGCGHYTIAELPFNAVAANAILRFLRRTLR